MPQCRQKHCVPEPQRGWVQSPRCASIRNYLNCTTEADELSPTVVCMGWGWAARWKYITRQVDDITAHLSQLVVAEFEKNLDGWTNTPKQTKKTSLLRQSRD